MTQTVKIMTLNKMKYLIVSRSVLTLELLLLLTACSQIGKQDAKAVSSHAAIEDTVPVFILRSDTPKKTLELPGELIPYEQTDLYAKISGFVQTMKVDIGDRVHKGQTLAIIEAPEVNTQIAQAESSIRAQEAKWATSKDNYERLFRASKSPSPGIVAPVDLVNARNQMLADSAAFAAGREQTKAYREVSGYLFITAPYEGVITARKTDPGALVGAGTMLLTVQYNRTLRLRVAVPETYTASVSSGANILFNVDAYPEQRFTGVLTRKTETVDPVTRTELWEFEVDNSRHLLKAGLFANVKINIQRKGPSFVIPPSAIATTLERKFVIKIVQGAAAWVDVQQGMTTDTGIEIFGSLKTGDTLMLKSTDERKPGSKAYWKVIP
jgi:membrane fusion protein, multidrug efflux system